MYLFRQDTDTMLLFDHMADSLVQIVFVRDPGLVSAAGDGL